MTRPTPKVAPLEIWLLWENHHEEFARNEKDGSYKIFRSVGDAQQAAWSDQTPIRVDQVIRELPA